MVESAAAPAPDWRAARRLRRGAGLLCALAALAGCTGMAGPPGATPSTGSATVSRQTGVVNVGAAPTAITLDGRGRIWVVNSGDQTVMGLDPAGATVTASIPVEGSPQRAAWSAGALWVTTRSPDAVVRVDLGARKVTHTIPLDGAPYGIAAAYGSLWVVISDDGTLVRIDPQTRRRLTSAPIGKDSRRITAGGSAVWVSDEGTGRIFKVVPLPGGRHTAPESFTAGCRQPRGMLPRDGLLWVACLGSDEVVALDERTGTVVRRVALPGGPDSLAPAPQSNMWVSLQDGPGLALLDPRAERIVSHWPIAASASPAAGAPPPSPPAPPVDVTMLGNKVWLTSFGNGRLLVIDVSPTGE